MKRKLAILLSSVVAGVGLVGATFAAWAVTDNADPFGIKISPGDITDTITYDTLTLEWGETSKFVAVSNLQVDTPQYRYVQVKAIDSKVGTTKGSLKATFKDETEGHDSPSFAGHKLIDYLHVDVYKVATNSTIPAEEEIELSLPTAGNAKTDQQDIDVPNNTIQNLAFKVYLPSTGVTSTIYEEIKNDVVNLEIDWNKSSAHTAAEGTIIYYSGPIATDYVPRVYAWSTTSIAVNGEFGSDATRMTLVPNTNVYSYVLKNTFDRVIFIYGPKVDNEWQQTPDIVVTSDARSTKPMYVYSDDEDTTNDIWDTLALVEHGYYIVGSQNGWKAATAFKLPEPVSGDTYTTSVTVSADESANGGVDFKILNTRTNQYYSEYDINGGSNFHLGEAGTYTITFNANQTLEGGTYIHAVKQ